MTTIMNKLTLTERYNVRKVAFLYTNLEKYGPKVYAKCNGDKKKLANEIKKLKSFLGHVMHRDGVIEVTYKTNKDGRIFGAPYTIQNISGVVPNFLLEDDNVVDVDIVNSISCVLLSLCKKHRSSSPTIIETYYGGDKDLCKDFINPSFFKKYEQIKTKNDFEKKMKKTSSKFMTFFMKTKNMLNIKSKQSKHVNVTKKIMSKGEP